MTQSLDHLADELLSAFVDEQLTPAETAQVQAHLQSCPACLERLEGLRSVALLLRALPEESPPRDFKLRPRLLVDAPNVIRLRRWYTATRIAAGSLAAAFVVLSAGTLYVDSRPASAPAAAEVAAPRPLSTSAQSQSAPAAPPAARAPAAGAAAAVRSAPANAQADDQVAAATTVKPLPTSEPTPVRLAPVAALTPAESVDAAAPLRIAAVVVGLLAVFSLLAALVVRHRLPRQPSQP